MNKNSFTYGLRTLMILTAALFVFSCNDEEQLPGVDLPGLAPEVSFTALIEGNRIAQFEARELNAGMEIKDITGLVSGDNLISIDYRPATGQLYALGTSSRLYIINENTGEATALGEASFSPAISGANASIDFNPTVDRIRLVTESGQNLRLHPELGTVVATDGNISGGMNPRIGAIAYTNSRAGASTTELFDVDFEANKLYVQDPPNDGGLREIGDLGVDFMGMGNFDITPDNSIALAVTRSENESRLFTINLTNGRAQWVGTFNLPVIGISFKTEAVAYAASEDNMLYRFNPMNPEMNGVAFQGLLATETVVGLDFRPANGQLYAITNLSRIMRVNTANGQLTVVGSPLNPLLLGGSFGFDFNPTVDRIRLVSNLGQNLRLHPDLGTVVAVDGELNPGTPFINGAAYTNNTATATSTVLFVIDSETNMLYRQDPPNDGGLVAIGSLGVDFTSDNGFDIGGKSNMAFALLEVAGMTGVYSINLESGAATKVADFNINATAMAVGLGF
ncbi:DUF4394 domain-containing protein [Belliella pelovolcani]|uniref:DUF4394 domain-containing protein n=1 Tax=Belliella pelovolcani TaxID=529505 RepID=A0A1N7NBD7_9BACT|nr:DUF4394 domain-containing protein [Belliella pelovolcani]SIS95568.1 protein of unknown function [Belliella pelovolcani]